MSNIAFETSLYSMHINAFKKPAYLLGDFIIEIGLAGSIGLYKIGCFRSAMRVNTHFGIH